MSHDPSPTREKDYEADNAIDHRLQPRVKILRPPHWLHEAKVDNRTKMDACLASIKARGRFFALVANELQATKAKEAIDGLSQGVETVGTVTLIDNRLLRALQALEECVQQRPRGKELRTAAARWREAHHRHLEWQKESMAIVPTAFAPSLNLPLLFTEAKLPTLADCVVRRIVDFAGIAEPYEACCASLTTWLESDATKTKLNLQTRGPTDWMPVSERNIVKSRVARAFDCSCSVELFFLQLRTILHACVSKIDPGCRASCSFTSNDDNIRLELSQAGDFNLATLSPWGINVGVAFTTASLLYDFILLSDYALSSSWRTPPPLGQIKTFKSLRFLNRRRRNLFWNDDFPYAVFELRRCLHDEDISFAYSTGGERSHTSSLKLFQGSFA